METLAQKAQRLGMKPAGQPTASFSAPTGETLMQKAQRLGMKPASKTFQYPVQESPMQRENKIARYQQEAQVAQQESEKANSFMGKLGNFGKAFGSTIANSEVGLGQSLAKIMNVDSKSTQGLQQAQQMNETTKVNLIKKIREVEARGDDATKFKQLYNEMAKPNEVDSLLKETQNLPSTSKVVGQMGGTALDLLTAGTYGKAKTGAMSFGQLAPSASSLVQKSAVASGIPELAPIAGQKASGLLTWKGAGNIGKGAGIGYASDVTQGLQGARGDEREGGKAFIPGIGTAIGVTLPAISETGQSFKNKFDPETKATILTQKRNRELSKLDSYQTLKKATEKGRERGIDVKKVLSETDVLHGAVDNTGTIHTKGEGGAVEQYTKQFISGNEATVSDALEKEGRSISLDVVRKRLRQNVLNAGIEGDALETALVKIDKEIAGYARRGGNSGTVPVATLHTAKVDKYSSINFFTEGNTKKYDKTVAKALKELVEENTTSVKVADINKELSKHFAVIDYLNKLDNKKVEGGKLGKYFAQTVGAIVGSHFGPLGAIGGAEAGGLFKGGLMSRVFNGKTGKVQPQAQSILDAKKTINEPPLGLPAKGETTKIPSKPINLGARSQSTIDAPEGMNPNIGTTAKGYQSTGKLNLTGDTKVGVLENPNKELSVIPFGKTQSNKAGSLKSNQTTTIPPTRNIIPPTLPPKPPKVSKGLGTVKLTQKDGRPATWQELQKKNPDLFNRGILRKSLKPMDAEGVIPENVHTTQGKWQNYGQDSEISADIVYKRIESGSFKGEYEDKLGNAVRDKNGNILQDTYDDATGQWTKPMVSNKELRDELLAEFSTKEGKQYLSEVISALPKNKDGSITAYRIGEIGDGTQSYTLSEGMAKTFSNQGTDIMPAGLPGLPTKGYKDFGALPANMVKIDPKGIKAWSPYDAEILVDSKFVQKKGMGTVLPRTPKPKAVIPPSSNTFVNPINKGSQDPMQIPYDWASYTSLQKRNYLDALEEYRNPKKTDATDPKNFKSLEEYVKAQPTYYHGTDVDFAKFDPNAKPEDFGTWFTPNRSEIVEMKPKFTWQKQIKPGTPLATEAQWEKAIENLDVPYKDFALNSKYRGIKYDNGTVQLFHPNEDLVSKSQLTDIWNKANKKP